MRPFCFGLALVSQEMEEELPDVAAMKILAEGCASIVATNSEARKYWNAMMPIEVEHFVRIVSSPDSVAAYPCAADRDERIA